VSSCAGSLHPPKLQQCVRSCVSPHLWKRAQESRGKGCVMTDRVIVRRVAAPPEVESVRGVEDVPKGV